MTWQTQTHISPDPAQQYQRSPNPLPLLRRRGENGWADEQRWPVQSIFGPLLHQVDRVAD